MKVNTEPESRNIAVWLNFLRHALGSRIAELAEPGMSRSNLTTFINTGGQPGWVSVGKARRALFKWGVCADGTLRPGLHRWRVSTPELVETMVSILIRGDISWGLALRLRQGGGYLMLRLGRVISVFAELNDTAYESCCRSELMTSEGPISVVQLDQDGDAFTQMLWMSEDEPTVLEHFEALRDLRSVGKVPTSAARN